MSSVKIVKPRIKPSAEYNRIRLRGLEEEDAYYDFLIDEGEVASEYARHVRLSGGQFRNVTFTDTVLESLDLVDARFENCDLSGCKFTDSRFERVEFLGCRLMGTIFSDSTFKDCRFHASKLDYAIFGFAGIKNCLFDESQMVNCNFQDADIKHSGFENSSLIRAQMSGAKLKGIDFTTCEIDGVGIRLEDLKGMIVSPVQAMELSRLMGLVIKD